MSGRIVLSSYHSIEECLKKNPSRVSKLLIPTRNLTPKLEHLKYLAEKAGVKIEAHPNPTADEPVSAILKEYQYTEFEVLVETLKEELTQDLKPVVLILDGITDAHNLGAILRTAAFMGIGGVILPKDRAASINEAVFRIASGGVEYLRIAQVTNLVSAVKALKEIGYWSIGFSEHAAQGMSELKLDFPPAILIGNEEKGLRPLIKENCDFLVKLQTKGGLESLNASVAASLAMAWAVKLF